MSVNSCLRIEDKVKLFILSLITIFFIGFISNELLEHLNLVGSNVSNDDAPKEQLEIVNFRTHI